MNFSFKNVKAYLLSALIISILFFISYKNIEKNNPEIVPSVSVQIETTIKKDDVFRIFYTSKKEEGFTQSNNIFLNVKGNTSPQILVFQLPPFKKLRIDFSDKNKNQLPIEIQSLKFSDKDTSITIPREQIAKFFRANPWVSISKDYKITPITLDGKYEPSLVLRDGFYEFKERYINLYNYFWYFVLLFTFIFFSIIPVCKVLLKQKRLYTIKQYQWFLFAFSILLFKGIFKIYYADLWAEDGRIFYQQAITLGIKSFFKPYAGYCHTLPRILIYLFSFFHAVFLPFLIIISTYSIYSFVLIQFTKLHYTWIIKNSNLKPFIIILLCFAPGVDNVVGNLANLHWILLAFLGVLSLKELSYKYTLAELVFSFLCIASEGATIILLPVFILRVIIKKTHKRKLSEFVGELIILAFIIIFSIININLKDSQSSTELSSDLLVVWLQNFISHFALAPFFGDSLTFRILTIRYLYLLSILIITGTLIIPVIKNISAYKILVYTLIACISVLPVMIAMARHYNLTTLLYYFDWNENWWRFRYSFILPFFGYIFIGWLISKIQIQSINKFIILYLLLVAFIFNKERLFFEPIGYNQCWIKQAKDITAAKKGEFNKALIIPINPKQWKVTIPPNNKK